MTGEREERALDRGVAQFFFEIGYGACWAEAFVRAGSKPPFLLTDAFVEHAWEIAGEAHDDPVEFDTYLARAAIGDDPQERDADGEGEIGLRETSLDLLRAMQDDQRTVGFRLDLWNRLQDILAQPTPATDNAVLVERLAEVALSKFVGHMEQDDFAFGDNPSDCYEAARQALAALRAPPVGEETNQ